MRKEDLKKLRSIPIFANISEKALVSLSKVLKEERWSEGERVIRTGDSADSIYLLKEGEVEVRKVLSRQPEKYKLLTILEEGDIFGEMAVFGEEYRSADVVVRKDSILWKMDYSELFHILNNDPHNGIEILKVILTILTARIRALNNELVTLYELSKLIPSLNDTETLTKAVFDQVLSSIEPAKSGLLAIWNTFNEEFDISQSTEELKDPHLKQNDPISTWMFETRSPILIKESELDFRFSKTFYAGASFIASPMLHEDRLLGFILLSHPTRKNAFNYNHMILLSTVCTQVAARLNDIERKKEEILKQRLDQGRLTVNI
jgi:CRP-like cAMP-binding protein